MSNYETNHPLALIREYQKTGDGLTLSGLSQQTGLPIDQLKNLLLDNEFQVMPVDPNYYYDKDKQFPKPILEKTIFLIVDNTPLSTKKTYRTQPPADPNLPKNPITILPRHTPIIPYS